MREEYSGATTIFSKDHLLSTGTSVALVLCAFCAKGPIDITTHSLCGRSYLGDGRVWVAPHPRHQPHGSEVSVRGGGVHAGPSGHHLDDGDARHDGNGSGDPGRRNNGSQLV